MKINELRNELKGMDSQQLETKVDELRRELLTLRLQAATSAVKGFPTMKRNIKRAIAHGMTLLRQKSSL